MSTVGPTSPDENVHELLARRQGDDHGDEPEKHDGGDGFEDFHFARGYMTDLPKMKRYDLVDLNPEFFEARKRDAEAAAARTPITWTLVVESINGAPTEPGDFESRSMVALSPGSVAHRWASELSSFYDDELIAVRVMGNSEIYRFAITTEVRRERTVVMLHEKASQAMIATIRGRAYWIDRAGPVAKLLRGDVCPGVVVELVDGRAFALYDDASPTPYANLAEIVADHCRPSLAPAILRVAITGSISVRTRVRTDMLAQIYAAYTRRPDYTELKSWNVFHG
jgi:hypothetical protein